MKGYTALEGQESKRIQCNGYCSVVLIIIKFGFSPDLKLGLMISTFFSVFPG